MTVKQFIQPRNRPRPGKGRKGFMVKPLGFMLNQVHGSRQESGEAVENTCRKGRKLEKRWRTRAGKAKVERSMTITNYRKINRTDENANERRLSEC